MIEVNRTLEMHIPKVSVGMPVYNGEDTLRCALNSLLGQSFADFELIISDNASTDGTESICREYAEQDRRIRYVRQSKNVGAVTNFKLVLDEARGDYFMWAAHDDIRSADYLEVNVSFLDHNPDFVASTSPTRFDNGKFNEVSMGDASLEANRINRLIKFFDTWHANGRFYSLIRRDVLEGCGFVSDHFLAADWAIVLFLANHGKMHRDKEGYVVLGSQGLSNSMDIFRVFRKNAIDYFLPFHNLFKVTLTMFGDIPLPARIHITWILVKLNYNAHIIQTIFYLRNKKWLVRIVRLFRRKK